MVVWGLGLSFCGLQLKGFVACGMVPSGFFQVGALYIIIEE